MSEHIFKPGELAWSPQTGFSIIKRYSDLDNTVIVHGTRPYFNTGKYRINDAYPTLLTLEQAKELGYFPEKKKVKKVVYSCIVKLMAKRNSEESFMRFSDQLFNSIEEMNHSYSKHQLWDAKILKIIEHEIELEE